MKLNASLSNTFAFDNSYRNFNYHKFDIDGGELTQMQCIHRMVDDCAVIIKSDEFEEMEKIDAAKDDLFKVLSKVFWAMWW